MLELDYHIRLLSEARECFGNEHIEHLHDVMPLLSYPRLNETNFYHLLPLRLPASWNALAISTINQHIHLNPMAVQALIPYHHELVDLIKQQRRSDDLSNRKGIEDFYYKIVRNNY